MLRSLQSGVSGLEQFQGQLDVIGNNIANANTVGFKSARAEFADTFSDTLQSAGSASGGGSAPPAIQVGSGVTTAAVRNLYGQGAPTATGIQSDLEVLGNGFFIVSDPQSGFQYATRAGDFRVDDQGYLVTTGGLRVQGFNDTGLSSRGDLRIDATGRPATADPAASLVSFNVDGGGKINVRLSDGTSFVRGQVLLQNFSDPQSLTKQGNNLYANLSAAGPLPATAAPGTSGLGDIQSGALELSNVDLANEFANLITAQRGFQANARVITTSDEVLQELVNLKR
jgi:flagellar hook protein FlgE